MKAVTAAPLRALGVAAGLVLLAACGPKPPETTAAEASAEAAAEARPTAPAEGEPTLDPAAPPPTTAATDATTRADAQWQCGDQRVAARFDHAAQTVTVVHDRGEVVLPQSVAASGTRYSDANGNEFWTQGPSGSLTLSGTAPRECSEVAAGGAR